jgi:CubicO group peptidase (beta-lactamase class C family)
MPLSDPIQSALQQAVEAGTFPGVVLMVEQQGAVVYEAAVGRRFPQEPDSAVTLDTWYDLASLTKVLATTTAWLLLVEQGLATLETPINQILEELRGSPIGSATVAELLTHSSGLPGWRPYHERIAAIEVAQAGFLGSREARRAVLGYIAKEDLQYERGSRSLYSDLGFMLLGFGVERLSGESLDRFSRRRIYDPLEAYPLSYVPRQPLSLHTAPPESELLIAPTEEDPWRGRTLCGEVHDENAFALGGIAGHAGLFGTARAVLAVGKAWLEGRKGHSGLLDPCLAQRFTMRQPAVPNSSWALGWDTPSSPSSSGTLFSSESFGHLGYTGTSLWIDPSKDLQVVLLSNRVHPTRRNDGIRAFRPLIHDLVYRELVNT